MSEADDPRRDVVGVVLAGGQSRRMGREKALLSLHGELLVARSVRRLREALPVVVVVGPRELMPHLTGTRVLPDHTGGQGPLGGLATAFAEVAARRLFLVACDMPFVVPAVVGAMLEAAAREPWAQAVVLRSTRGLEPLHALYDISCASMVSAQLARGERSLHHLLDHLARFEIGAEAVAALDPVGCTALNVNTPEEWERAVRLASGEHGGDESSERARNSDGP